MLVISVPYNIVWEESSFSFPGDHEVDICWRIQISRIVWLWADVCDLIVWVQILTCDDQQRKWARFPDVQFLSSSSSERALWSQYECAGQQNRQTLVVSVTKHWTQKWLKFLFVSEHSPLTFTHMCIYICCSCAVNHSSSCSPGLCDAGWDSRAHITWSRELWEQTTLV